LAGESGFHSETVVKAFTTSGLQIVTPDEAAPWLFWATVQFQTSRIGGELTYGDREFVVNLTIGRTSTPDLDRERYGLWEWAAALGVADPRAGGGQLVLTTAGVQSIVAGIGSVLAAIWPRIATASSDVIASMDTARARVQAEYAEAEARREHDRIVSQAAEAFRLHDFRRVIELLEPLSERLTNAERKRLQLARRRAEAAR